MQKGIVYVDFSSLNTFFFLIENCISEYISVDNFNLQFLLSFLPQNCLDLKAFTCFTVLFLRGFYVKIKTIVLDVEL